jgi:tetratricopeptide (TPR) repeat protein
LPEDSSAADAQQWLVASRRNGDRAGEASALIDLGLLALSRGDAVEAVSRAEEVLRVARSLDDGALQRDIVGNVGYVLLMVNRPQQARPHLEQALTMARDAGDRCAEKLTLERLASARAVAGDLPTSLELLDEALTITRTLGDRQQEVDLLWHMAVRLAESRKRQEALNRAEEAVALLKRLGQPQATLYSKHLEKYRSETAAGGTPALGGVSSGSIMTTATEAANAQSTAVPPRSAVGYLRMAISAGKALAQFVGSGMKLVTTDVFQQRLQLCGDCSYHTGLRCRVCGCFTKLKGRLPHESCPLGQWPTALP